MDPGKVRPTSAFGERLADLRAERGIAQAQLAAMIGSSHRGIIAALTATGPLHVVPFGRGPQPKASAWQTAEPSEPLLPVCSPIQRDR